MPLPESPISLVCNAVCDLVKVGVASVENLITVSLGPPATVASENDVHRINLFFYRFEPDGFNSTGHPNEPWRIRMFCLISFFGIDEGEVLAGENDLRMLGEVMRIFRQQPILEAILIGGESVRLQAVFTPLNDEQINQVWSTQGDATYRPSVVYEMGLTPIFPTVRREPAPLVGAVGTQVRGTQAARFAAFSGIVQGPPVTKREVGINNPHWAPALCWVYQGGCAHSLSFDVSSDEFVAFSAQIWLAGDSSVDVSLEWEEWHRSGWRSVGAVVTVNPFSTTIDPDDMPLSAPPFPLDIVNPITIPDGENAAQGVLYAIHTVEIPGQATVTVRSNPLLLSLYR